MMGWIGGPNRWTGLAKESNVNNWKRVLVVCGVIGVLTLLVPIGGRSLLEADRVAGLVHLAVFALPAAMAAIGLMRPPMRAWQSGAALAVCVLGLVRFHVWELALELPSAGDREALLFAAMVIQAVASVATLLRPEARPEAWPEA
jgi:hypothetical protein